MEPTHIQISGSAAVACVEKTVSDNVLTPKLLLDCSCFLGEGIQWNADRARLYWTDIFRRSLWSCDENGDDATRQDLPTDLCAFAFADNGLILAAFTDGLYWFDEQTGKRTLIKAYDPNLTNTRMNDGGLDRQGRFIVGGMDENGMNPITPVWSVSPSGIKMLIKDIGCSNSTAFSPDGTTMYFADSARPEILQYDYDTEMGTAHNGRLFAKLRDGSGIPDGSTVDAEGGLWNAQFGGSCVQRYLPDGTPDIHVALPVPNPACCCIGGKSMNRLFISTATANMTDAELAAQPGAGGIYAIDIPVRGLAHGTYKT